VCCAENILKSPILRNTPRDIQHGLTGRITSGAVMTLYTVFDQTDTNSNTRIETSLFGGNVLNVYTELLEDNSSLGKQIKLLGLTELRFPGGSITEHYFDIENPEATQASWHGATKDVIPLRGFLDVAAGFDTSVTIVLPTSGGFTKSAGAALLDHTYGARSVDVAGYIENIKDFVLYALAEANARGVTLTAFEIGNEFWGSGQMTAKEYGDLSAHIAVAIEDALLKSGVAVADQPDIVMQSLAAAGVYSPNGNGIAYVDSHGDLYETPTAIVGSYTKVTVPAQGTSYLQNKALLAEINGHAGAGDALDGILNHYYTRNGFAGVDSEENVFNQLDLWDTQLNRNANLPDLEHYITEWNTRAQDGFANNRGLQQAAMLVEQLYEMATHGVTSAQIWPLTFTWSQSSAMADTDDDDLSIAGEMFRLMRESIVGKTASLDWSVSGAIDVHGFSGQGDHVFFAAERSGNANSTIDLNLSNSLDSGFYVVSSVMLSDDGYGGFDEHAPAVVTEFDSYILGNNIAHFDLEAWSIMRLELTYIGAKGTALWSHATAHGAQVDGGNNADIIIGKWYSERIEGYGGDDTIQGGAGNDTLIGGDGDDWLLGGAGNEIMRGGTGNDVLEGGAGNDWLFTNAGQDYLTGQDGADTFALQGTTFFSAGYLAANTSSHSQTGTGIQVSLAGLVRNESVADGGAGSDTIQLGAQGDAFFLHDAYSDFNETVDLSRDSSGNQSVARFSGIETILGMGGNDVIDLTSPDYSLAGLTLTIDGGVGNDVIWGSDGDERILGGAGNDSLFGGTGDDTLVGGGGADSFEFTRSSTQTRLVDFNPDEGDVLRFYNTGGATFDADSLHLTQTGVSISYVDAATSSTHHLEITLAASPDDFNLTLSDIQNALDIL